MRILTADGEIFESFEDWLNDPEVAREIASVKNALQTTTAAAIQVLLLTQIAGNTSLGYADDDDE